MADTTHTAARRLHDRLAPHVAQLARILHDLQFELQLTEDFIEDDSDWVPAERVAQSNQIIREACADATEINAYVVAITRGEATDSPFDPENRGAVYSLS